MTTKKIAEALTLDTFSAFQERDVIPPWCDPDDEIVRNAFAQAKTTREHRDYLVNLWPHKKEDLDRQCDEAILTIAAELYSKLYDVTP